eukprot:g2133.t1
MEDPKRTLDLIGAVIEQQPSSQNNHTFPTQGPYGGGRKRMERNRGRRRGGRIGSNAVRGRGCRRFRQATSTVLGTLPEPNKLLISVCCSSLWYKECHSNSVDVFPDRLPTSFESMEHYTKTFVPFLLEEARESIKSAFADCCEQNCFWNVKILSVETQGNGWVKIEILTKQFNSGMRPPKLFPNVSAVLTTIPPSKEDPLENVQQQLTLNQLNSPLQLQQQQQQSVPAAIISGIIIQTDHSVGKVTLRARPVCEKHLGNEVSRCKALLNDLRMFPNSWLMFPTGGIVTQQREYDILHSLHKIPVLDAILKPDENLNMSIENVPRKLPRELGTGIQEFIYKKYDTSQADAILMCTAHFCKESRDPVDDQGSKNLPILLIQGPPGTGKTHTVQGILNLWHLVHFERYYKKVIEQYRNLAHSLGMDKMEKSELASARIWMKPRILVCAPSNAAVDELLERIVVHGFHDSAGRNYKPNLIRVGAEDAPLCSESRLVSLDNLVSGYMNLTKFEWCNQQQYLIHQVQYLEAEIHGLEEKLMEDEKNVDLLAGSLLSKMEKLEKMETDLNRLKIVESVVNEVCPNERNTREALELNFLDGAEMVFTTLSNEAAQASEVAALQPLIYGCQQCVLVGDPQQLPATILSPKAKQLNLERSLFARLQEAGAPAKLLKTQYRMHPLIRSFPSMFFYNNVLEDGDNIKENEHESFYDHDLLKPYVVFDVPTGFHERQGGGSLQNQVEADLAVALFRELRDFLIQKQNQAEKDGSPKPKPVRVGVLTPYRSQTQCLTNTFTKKLGAAIASEVKIMTVDSCQGKQLDVVIFSCVRGSLEASSVGFVSDTRRMNVAITRAKKALWILGNFRTLVKHPAWAALAADAEDRECLVVASTAESLFPHHEYQEPLKDPANNNTNQTEEGLEFQIPDPRVGVVKALHQETEIESSVKQEQEQEEGNGVKTQNPAVAGQVKSQDLDEEESSVSPPSARTNTSTEDEKQDETNSVYKRTNPVLKEQDIEDLSSRKRLCQTLPVMVVKTAGDAKIIGPSNGRGEATLTIDTPLGLISTPVEILYQGQEGFQPQLLLNAVSSNTSNQNECTQSKKRTLADSHL